MAILENIRTKFGLGITIIIAVALLYFIIDPSTLDSTLSSMSSKYDVGQIDGKSISYTDFQAEVDRFSGISEIMTGSSARSEQQQEQIRNSAWQSLIDKYLFVKNAKAAGINVGEAEMLALTTGDMVSPIIAQNYMFADKDGNYNPDALVEFVQNSDSDPSGKAKDFWNYLQNTVYTQQFYAKYGSLFTQSSVQNTLMLEKAIAENNNTVNVEFVMVPFGYQQDSTVVVSNSEIKDYYNSHKDFFKQGASRDAEYVVYEVIPSSEDISATNDKMSEIYDEFASTDNIKNFLSKNSERAYTTYWYKAGELKSVSSVVSEFVDNAKTGDVSTILSEGNTFYGVRVLAETKRSETVTVKVIAAQKDETITDELLTNLDLSNEFTLTQANCIPGCESLFDAAENKPYFINTPAYGQVLAKLISKSEPVEMKQVAILEKTALASAETFNSYYAKANKFASLANGSYDNYKAAVDTMGVYSHPVNKITEGTSNFGAIDNAKEVTRWIFENKPGKVSNIITVNNNFFFVVTVKGIHKEGYAPVEDVAYMIQNRLYAEKLGEKKAAEVKTKIEGLNDLQAIAEALNTTVSSQSDLAFASMKAQGLDPAFIGAASVSPEGKICGPLAGAIGVYVYKVTGHDTAAFYTEDDAKNFTNQKNQYSSQMIIPVMMDDADVKDNRARFY